ncbi:MAG: methyl-accepting chemotaxis protein [Acidobacteriota bacterium]|nr:methyl-accepting chemotaxis protein [Acidobacteriota bacterium]
MADINVPLLRDSFAALAPRGAELIHSFYETLFRDHPEVKAIFVNVDMSLQEKQLLASLVFLVENLENPDRLIPALKNMGKRHQNYGVEPAHYDVVARTLVAAMREYAGSTWNEALETAWNNALGFVARTFLEGYEERSKESGNKEEEVKEAGMTNQQDNGIFAGLFADLPTAAFAVDGSARVTAWNRAAETLLGVSSDEIVGKKAWSAFYSRRRATPVDEALREGETIEQEVELELDDGTAGLLFRVVPQLDEDDEPTGAVVSVSRVSGTDDNLKWALEGASTAVITVDHDLIVTYANTAAFDLFRTHIRSFQTAYPGFSPDNLIGTRVDILHQNPSHWRHILSEPNNLPYKADLSVGELTFALNVTGSFNDKGDYVGATMEWQNVTEQRAGEHEAALLSSSIEGAGVSMMTVDRDLRITYINPSSLRMIRENLSAFQIAFPGFNPDELVGTCVDRFHKNPMVQRRILDNPANLPYKADINIGPLIFELNVNALRDKDGNYIGNTLEWYQVTEQRAKEDEAARLTSAVMGSATAQMTVDRDLIITTINPAVRELMGRHLETFKREFPGFNLEDLVGTCVDRFHKNPAHQRNLLSDPNNLPYQADIHVGPLTFSLNVTAMRDGDGNYIGNNLEWDDVTEARAKATRVTALESMIENAATNLMMCDRDLRITYCNPAVVNLLTTYRAKLAETFPGFDPSRLVGACIDDFHIDPAKQRSLLSDPRNLPHKAEITVAGLEFGLNATALYDENGEVIGNAVEWIDYNDRAVYRDEVNLVIQAATGGDLKKRGNLSSLSDAYQPMMQGINNIIDAIVAPITELKTSLQGVSHGDLTSYVSGSYEGDHAVLKEALNQTLDGLNDILSEVRQVSSQVNTGARQVSDASQSLSQGATEQASALEEITASMTEMAAQTKQNAENATQANQLAVQCRKGAENGNEQMQQMLVSMRAIDESSSNISKIIKVIDEIAFQTNLLALNAAVEAARAGVHGKGFAVVAEEVRNLAARSANAAKETTQLIEESIQKVNQGSNIAGKTADALNEIVQGIGKVTDLVAEIAAASNEQAQGIAQANKALGQMDQVTQQNTANAEQSAAASQELSSQANKLMEMLTRFTLKEKQQVGGQGGLPPEMMAAFQRFMEQHGMGGMAAGGLGAPGMGSVPAPRPAPAPQPMNMGMGMNMGMPEPSGNIMDHPGSSVDPTQIISLDDDEFGKY